MDLTERIGAHVVPDGCFFRVWAPNATRVSVVVQDGDHWELDDGSAFEQPLVRVGDYWSGTVPGRDRDSSTGSGSAPPTEP